MIHQWKNALLAVLRISSSAAARSFQRSKRRPSGRCMQRSGAGCCQRSSARFARSHWGYRPCSDVQKAQAVDRWMSVAWHISNTRTGSDDFCVETLNEAIHPFGAPEIMNMAGSHPLRFASTASKPIRSRRQWLGLPRKLSKDRGVAHLLMPPGNRKRSANRLSAETGRTVLPAFVWTTGGQR